MTPPPVGPLTSLIGWRAFVHRTITVPHLQPEERLSSLDAEERAVDVEVRIGYRAELLALQTPDLHKIVATGRSLLLLNHRQHGARRGLLVSGAPTTGKSTAITQLGRAVEVAHRRTPADNLDAAFWLSLSVMMFGYREPADIRFGKQTPSINKGTGTTLESNRREQLLRGCIRRQ